MLHTFFKWGCVAIQVYLGYQDNFGTVHHPSPTADVEKSATWFFYLLP